MVFRGKHFDALILRDCFFMNLPNEVLYTEMCLCESIIICTDYYIYIESSMYISYEVWCKKV